MAIPLLVFRWVSERMVGSKRYEILIFKHKYGSEMQVITLEGKGPLAKTKRVCDDNVP